MEKPKRLNIGYQLHRILRDIYWVKNSRLDQTLVIVKRKLYKYRNSKEMEL